jgi:hypothetical protein
MQVAVSCKCFATAQTFSLLASFLEVSRIQANGKTYVELHPRTYVEFATKRHDFSQLNQKTELVRLASHCWRLGQLSWWNKRLGLGTLPH